MTDLERQLINLELSQAFGASDTRRLTVGLPPVNPYRLRAAIIATRLRWMST